MRMVKHMFKLIISGSISLLVISLISVPYEYVGVHIDNETGATDYKWEPNQIRTTLAEGYSWLKMDSNGFNNRNIFNGKIDILLMGSSHMEAINVKADENVGALLNDKLPEMNTYNIGISGHTIYHVISNLSAALNLYQPQEYLIVETDTIKLDIDKMKFVINNEFPNLKSHDTGLIYYVQKYVPGLKVIFNGLNNWKNQAMKTNQLNENTDIGLYEHTLEEFLLTVKEKANNQDVKVIIVYHPKSKLDVNGELIQDTPSEYLSMFKEISKEKEILFIDMTTKFMELYEETNRLAHGFSNTGIGTGHLNNLGHEAISDEIVSTIRLHNHN